MSLSDAEWDELAGRLRGLVVSLSNSFTPEECREVENFIDHDEFGEALHALVGIIVDEGTEISPEVADEIARLAERMGIQASLSERVAADERPTSALGF